MDHLPDEILENVVECLSPVDAVRLSNTSKKLHSQLSLTVSSPRQILTKQFRSDFDVPLTLQDPAHSIHISLKWRHFGCGRVRLKRAIRKGSVSVVSEQSEKNDTPIRRVNRRLQIDDDSSAFNFAQFAYDLQDCNRTGADPDAPNNMGSLGRINSGTMKNDGSKVIVTSTSDIDLRANRCVQISFKPKQNESYYLRCTNSMGDSQNHYDIKAQTLEFGHGFFGGQTYSRKVHHFLVKITTYKPTEELDEAMGKTNEIVFYNGENERNEMDFYH